MPKVWGFKSRKNPEYGYMSVWNDLVTVRIKADQPLHPTEAEFYDVSLGHQCNMSCPFCYTNAGPQGKPYENVVRKIEMLMNRLWNDSNKRPYQVAIGSEGEPTIHPEFLDVLRVFYEHGVVPNYTTNGRIFSDPDWSTVKALLNTTNEYCGGVAVSANPTNMYWEHAFDQLTTWTSARVNLHLICFDVESVEYIRRQMEKYDGKAWTFVILPLIANGRSSLCMTNEAYIELTKVIRNQQLHGKTQVAVGARMHPWLTDPKLPYIPHISVHDPEKFSKNLILDDPVRITPSSFDTKTILWSVY